ncbi:MAG: hypothetical protein WC091_01210 [Sulfuricellaceae bacterium]
MTTAIQQPAATLPAGIEIFKAGRRTDDAGIMHHITAEDVARTAAVYDPLIHEAALCVGHPKDNLPAYGWARSLAAESGTLTMVDTSQVEPQFAEMVKAGRFKNRSASFYPPDHARNPVPGAWYLRHIAFLGAQPPAVPGLKPIQFSEGEDAAGCINFCDGADGAQPQEKSIMTPEELTALEAKQAAALKEANDKTKAEQDRATALEQKLAQFAEVQGKERHAAHVSFCEAQVKAGKLRPADKAGVVATLDYLAAQEKPAVEFSEGDAKRTVNPLEVVKALVASGGKVVSFGEHAPANMDGGVVTKGMPDAELDVAVKKYMREKSVSYSQALDAVISFTL